MMDRPGCRAWPVFLTIPFLNAAAVAVCAAPVANTDLGAPADSAGYDVFATLPEVGPQQQLLLDWTEGGLVLTFDADKTTLRESG